MSETSRSRNSRVLSHYGGPMINLIGWVIMLLAVLLGLFLTDGPGSEAHFYDGLREHYLIRNGAKP
jgi:hypothetical protein